MRVGRSIFSIVKSAGAFTIINQILFILRIDVKDKMGTRETVNDLDDKGTPVFAGATGVDFEMRLPCLAKNPGSHRFKPETRW